MSLKHYKRETLTGNWFEERAKPLNGVLADYGHRTEPKVAASSFSSAAMTYRSRYV